MNQAAAFDFGLAISSVADAGMLISTCNIRLALLVEDSFGTPVEDSPPANEDIVLDIPCMIGTPTVSVIQAAAEESRRRDLTRENEIRQVNLDGYYAEIERDMTVEVDSAFYNILSVIHDSQKTRTVLLVEASE